ncbi:MAG: DciA family protein [Fimbriimonadales bacterium]
MQQVGDALRKLLQQLGADRQFRTYDALVHWDEIVGKQVAQVARPLRLDADTLWVAVKSHAWAQELNFQKGTILRRLNERAGEERFKEIRFVVRMNLPAAVIPTPTDPVAPVPPPVSESEARQVEARLSGITDPILHDVLKRAQLATLRYQKFLAQQGWRRCPVCECYHCDDSAVCFLCERGV